MKEKKKYISGTDTAIAGGSFEINSRFGDAGAEFLKGLRGVDYEKGVVLNRNLIRTTTQEIKLDNLYKSLEKSASVADKYQLLPKNITNIMKQGSISIDDSKALEQALQTLKTSSIPDATISQIQQDISSVLSSFNRSLAGKLKQLQTSTKVAEEFKLIPKDISKLLKKGSLSAKDLTNLEKFQQTLKHTSVSTPEAQQALNQVKTDLNNTLTLVKTNRGFSAEVVYTNKQNAEAIIAKSSRRYARSEDLDTFGKNDSVVDIVEIVDGKQIATGQMKIVTNPENLIDKIAGGKTGNNDLSRYLTNDKLLILEKDVEIAKQHCRNKATSLLQQAEHLDKIGDSQKAAQLRQHAENYYQLEKKIVSVGMDADTITESFLNPKLTTFKNIASVSHRAGLEGAKLGAAIGGSISLITNMLAVKSGDKEFSEALMDTTTGTLKAAGFGYATAFAGSATKTLLQQSQSQALRSISKTGLPGMIVSLCASTTKSIYSYTRGDIDEGQLMQDLGGITTGAIASSLFTVTGQALIPIPVLGGIIGSMVGCIVVNTFYDGFFQALNDAKLAKENRIMVEMRCEAARKLSQQYREHFEWLFDTKLSELQQEKQQLLHILNQEHINADDFCSGMNQFASFLGKKLTINSMTELDEAMLSDQPIVI